MHEAGLHARKAAKKPFISEKNHIARLNWANNHLTWSLEKLRRVLWSDETSITLQSKCVSLVWRENNERFNNNCIRSTIKHDKKINIW